MGIFMFFIVPIITIAAGIAYPFYMIAEDFGPIFESIGNFFANL